MLHIVENAVGFGLFSFFFLLFFSFFSPLLSFANDQRSAGKAARSCAACAKPRRPRMAARFSADKERKEAKKKRGGKATAGGQTKHAMTRALLMECCVMLRTDAREDNPTERFRGWEERRWGAAPLHPSRIRNTHSVDTKKRSATPRLGLALGPHRAHDSFILTLTAGEGSKYE